MARPSSPLTSMDNPIADDSVLLPGSATTPPPAPLPQRDVVAASDISGGGLSNTEPLPSTSTSPSAVADPHVAVAHSETWLPVERLLQCRMYNGQRSYLVKWKGGNWPNSWEPEGNVTPALKEHFHAHYTYSGAKRKMLGQKPARLSSCRYVQF